MHYFNLAEGHRVTHRHDPWFRLSDIISFEQGHVHFHFMPVIAIAAIITIVGVGIWGLFNPKVANQPVPNSVLIPVGIVVFVVIIWVVILHIIYAAT